MTLKKNLILQNSLSLFCVLQASLNIVRKMQYAQKFSLFIHNRIRIENPYYLVEYKNMIVFV